MATLSHPRQLLIRPLRRYLDELDAAKTHLDGLLADTAATLDQLSEISASFKAVDAQTKAFQKQSASILGDQGQNEQLAKQISDNLQYYEPLERISRRLNAPGAGSLVRSRDFSDMLVTLDECVDYMQTHTTHKEAENYRSRYKLLLTRALTLVRNSFMSAVRDTAAEVTQRIADKQLNDTTMSTLLYAKFRVGAAEMKELGLEIQKRANPPADAPETEGEYQSLMNELHASYSACRAKLILPIVHKRLAETAQTPSSKDLVQFARSSISYVRGICLDEFELWCEWFHGQRGLYDLLESLCEPLYDYLRPRIIHENKISKLCSLVTLLQTRYLHDEEEDGLPDLNQLDFSVLIQPVVEDSQGRLVFKTVAVLRDEIENYKPKGDDLDYPRRNSRAPTAVIPGVPLSGRRGSRTSATPMLRSPEIVDEGSGDESTFSWDVRSKALQNCYPTLPKAIRLLSRIYRLVNSSVFDDLAHQIVHSTTVSLHKASSQISSKSSPADGQLFLLRHLLLLKSQIVAFDIEFVTPDVSFDFSGMTNTFYELRERGGLFNPSSWIKLFSSGGLIPKVVENMLDAKVELDGSLRTVINDFTAGFAADMTKNLPRKEPRKNAEDAVQSTRKQIEKEVPILRAKLEQYLDDMRTRETLVAAVEDQVVQNYEAFFDAFAGRGKVSKKGKSPENAVWDVDTFAEYAESVFGVILPAANDGEDERTSVGSRSLSRSRSS